jgi:hypothetical protein
MRTLSDWARERGVPDWLARRLFDKVMPHGLRAGLYRIVRPEDVPTLERALQERGASNAGVRADA